MYTEKRVQTIFEAYSRLKEAYLWIYIYLYINRLYEFAYL